MKTKAAATTLRRDAAPPPRSAGCGGDGCNARDPWPLHHVRHRTVFCRLCTSCVLKYQAGSFCVVCFDLFDALPPPAAPPVLVFCSRCPSVAHSACLPDAERASTYLCPSCSNPEGFSYFRVSKDGQQRSFDLSSAKVLLAATRLAAASMSRAAVAARAEAERKVREAAVARKRAREMLERVFTLSKIEKEKKKKKKEANEAAVVPVPEVVEPKKKMPKLSSTVAAMVGQKRVQNRDTDRWMKFQEPMVMVPKPVQGVVDDKSKVASLTGMQNHTNNGDMKGKFRSLPHAGNDVGQMESKERRVLSGTQSPFVKEEDGVVGRC